MTEPRVIRSIIAADFARIFDEFAKHPHPKDAMIFEIHALRTERDALREDAARLREAIDIFISFQGSTREPEGQAALNAALAVQPLPLAETTP